MKLFKGMESNQMQTTIWFMIITGVVILTTLFATSAKLEDDLVAELIREGQDPIELACVYKRSNDIAPACLLLIERRTHD